MLMLARPELPSAGFCAAESGRGYVDRAVCGLLGADQTSPQAVQH